MQSSIGRQCFELGTLQVDFLIVLWGFFGHASFGEGILVGFFFFFVGFCLLFCFVWCVVFCFVLFFQLIMPLRFKICCHYNGAWMAPYIT